jgi:hypothetical protein
MRSRERVCNRAQRAIARSDGDPLAVRAAMLTRPALLKVAPFLFERRRAPRFSCGATPVTVNAECHGALLNISSSGALLMVPVAQPVHHTVKLLVVLPDRTVELRGRVVRSTVRPVSKLAVALSYHVAVTFH